MIKMNNKIFNDRAERIAKDTDIKIIDNEIADWDKECNELSLKIGSLQSQLNTANERREVWLKAKKIKQGAD